MNGRMELTNRNVIGALAPFAALNNYLLPVYMIVLGVALVRWPANETSESRN